jgi:hypothetical protein
VFHTRKFQFVSKLMGASRRPLQPAVISHAAGDQLQSFENGEILLSLQEPLKELKCGFEGFGRHWCGQPGAPVPIYQAVSANLGDRTHRMGAMPG